MVLLPLKTTQRQRWTKITLDKIRQTEKKLTETYTAVPSKIFLDRELAPLESITEYLKDECGLSYHEIAVLVGRDDRTIWTSYNRAKKKRTKNSKQITPTKQNVQIPIFIFKNRALAPLESISAYLKESVAMSFHEIAVILNRDDRTIWTSYNRSQKKQVPN